MNNSNAAAGAIVGSCSRRRSFASARASSVKKTRYNWFDMSDNLRDDDDDDDHDNSNKIVNGKKKYEKNLVVFSRLSFFFLNVYNVFLLPLPSYNRFPPCRLVDIIFSIRFVGLFFSFCCSQDVLNRRLDERTEEMVERGLVDELCQFKNQLAKKTGTNK